MEPRAALAAYDPDTGRYTVYAGNGGAVRLKHDLATILGVPPEKVRVLMQDVGGNFGTRGMIYPEFALVAWAARRLGRPVKWTCERHESFLSDYQARDLAVEAELALDAQGQFPRDARLQHRQCRRPHHEFLDGAEGRRDHVEHLPRAGRAFPRPRGAQQHLADAALSQRRAAGSDVRDGAADRSRRARMRLRPRRAPPAQSGDRERRCRTAIRSAWNTTAATTSRAWTSALDARRLGRLHSAAAPRRRSAANTAASASATTSTPRPACRARSAEITVQPDGIVELVIGIVSQGQGHETSFAQLVTEWLGVPIDSGALRHRRHRPRHGRRRRAFRPRHAARQHRHQEIVRRHHRQGHAHRRASAGNGGRPTSSSRTAASR